MSAVLLQGPGAPADLVATSVARPPHGAGEVVVQVRVAGVNPSDVLNCLGLPITSYPRVPGRDFAGVVTEGPSDLLQRRVWGTGSGDLGFSRHGSHAEELVVPAAGVVLCPDRFSFEDAGASGLAYATASAGLIRGGLRSGTTVLVTGAAGRVGGAARAIARWRGARVIAAVRDDVERRAVESASPDAAVVVTDAEDWSSAVRALTDGRGADLCFDTVGNAVFEQVIACLAEDGAMVVISARPGTEVGLDLSQFYRRRLSLLGVSSTQSDVAWTASLLKALMPGFESGELPPVTGVRVLPLSSAAEAYTLVAGNADGARVALGVPS
ncbi:zinc-binding alcohol dehydrogenase family protein [Streptomyces chartreusis]|uniref:quinone oxidoreductase family protein n=1 Tax=Streptomyces chartreusis TaxID=1969 RepID=UPI003687C818